MFAKAKPKAYRKKIISLQQAMQQCTFIKIHLCLNIKTFYGIKITGYLLSINIILGFVNIILANVSSF